MNEPMITHRQIEAFRAVMVSSNMTEAGRMLSVTQSAISKIMKEFEREVGFALFGRRKGGLEPTPEAFAFYEEIERSYLGIDKIWRTAQRIRHREVGKLQIGAVPALASGFLQRVVRRFHQSGRGISAAILTYNSPELIDLVESRQCNIGFVMTPIDAESVVTGDVMNVRCVCILPPGHRLAEKRIVSITDLEGEDFISLAEGTPTRFKIDSLFYSLNINRRSALEARWAVAVAGFVAEGLGVSIIDPFSARSFAAQGGTVRPLREEVLFSFVHVQPKLGVSGGIGEEFLACFRSEFEEFKSEMNHLSGLGTAG